MLPILAPGDGHGTDCAILAPGDGHGTDGAILAPGDGQMVLPISPGNLLAPVDGQMVLPISDGHLPGEVPHGNSCDLLPPGEVPQILGEVISPLGPGYGNGNSLLPSGLLHQRADLGTVLPSGLLHQRAALGTVLPFLAPVDGRPG